MARKQIFRGFWCICLLALSGIGFLPDTASALPEGRVYEMVSPPYKGGYGVGNSGIEAVPDGERVAFFSKGAFAGQPAGPSVLDYVAHRGVFGWASTPEMPPATIMAIPVARDVSPSLDTTLALGKPGSNNGAAFAEGAESDLLVHPTAAQDTAAEWEEDPAVLKALGGEPFSVVYQGASPDFCHLFVTQAERPLLPEATETETKRLIGLLYEANRGCAGEPQETRLVGLNNSGGLINPACEVNLGVALYGGNKASAFNAIAADGQEVFFTSCVGSVSNSQHQLFVRLGGAKTLEVSKPLGPETCKKGEEPGEVEEVPCELSALRTSADFVGASEDGSKAFFTTDARLSSEDQDSTEDLYMARIGCPNEAESCEAAAREVKSVTQISHDPSPGQATEVQGVVRVSPDGSHIYFVARGVLTEGIDPQGQTPALGADNLYVYDSETGQTEFISELCSGPGVSGPGGLRQDGAIEDLRCPLELEVANSGIEDGRNDTKLWEGGAGEAQLAGGEGSIMVFSSYGQLTVDDTDTAEDVYRFDANTRVLERVSVGEAGYEANGNHDDTAEENANAHVAPGHKGERVQWQYEMDNRAINENGTVIVFDSVTPLSSQAINGLENAYEWHQTPGESGGEVSLISSGSSEEPVSDVVVSPEGNDIFFVTTQGLVPQDSDGATDIYDARVGGGFAAQPTSSEPCSSDACQGPLTNPAPLLVPGSVAQAPGENVTPPKRSVKKKVAVKKKKASAKQKHKRKNAKGARNPGGKSRFAAKGRAKR